MGALVRLGLLSSAHQATENLSHSFLDHVNIANPVLATTHLSYFSRLEQWSAVVRDPRRVCRHAPQWDCGEFILETKPRFTTTPTSHLLQGPDPGMIDLKPVLNRDPVGPSGVLFQAHQETLPHRPSAQALKFKAREDTRCRHIAYRMVTFL